jgi:hypothetical protein
VWNATSGESADAAGQSAAAEGAGDGGVRGDAGKVAAKDKAGQRVEPAQPPHRPLRRPRTLVITSAALIVLAGGAYGATTLSTQNGHGTAGTTGTAALNLPSDLVSAQGSASATSSASASASPSPSKTASKSANAVPQQVVTVVKSVVVSAAEAPATTKRSVATPVLPAPAGNWLLNQTTGNTAVDSTGMHDATASNGWWAGGSCLFNGSSSEIVTGGPVLSTGPGESFTVSAWVYMSALPVAPAYDETAVSQDANEASAFYLQFTEPSDRWAFSRVATDSSGSPAPSRALSDNPPSLSTWTHLVGVYDAAGGTETLYVNGAAQGTATDTTPFPSSGVLAIGRARFNGQDTDWLKGAIKKVEVFDTALTAQQVALLS